MIYLKEFQMLFILHNCSDRSYMRSIGTESLSHCKTTKQILPFTFTNRKTLQNLQGNIKAMFGFKPAHIRASGNLSEFVESIKEMANVTVYTFCNLHLSTFPSTAVDGIKLVDNFMKLMSEDNKDGVPIEMELIHISEFQQCGKEYQAWQDSK